MQRVGNSHATMLLHWLSWKAPQCKQKNVAFYEAAWCVQPKAVLWGALGLGPGEGEGRAGSTVPGPVCRSEEEELSGMACVFFCSWKPQDWHIVSGEQVLDSPFGLPKMCIFFLMLCLTYPFITIVRFRGLDQGCGRKTPTRRLSSQTSDSARERDNVAREEDAYSWAWKCSPKSGTIIKAAVVINSTHD